MTTDEKLDLLIGLVTENNERLDSMNTRFDSMDTRLDSMDTRFDSMNTRLDSMDTRLDSTNTRLDSMDTRLDSLDNEIKDIRLTLENVTNINIKRIAEGHLDLSRKLNEAIRISSDIQAKQELQDIYLNMHERKLKSII